MGSEVPGKSWTWISQSFLNLGGLGGWWSIIDIACQYRCKRFTWGSIKNFGFLYSLGVSYVAGEFPAVVILEILAWHPAASTEKPSSCISQKSMDSLLAARISEFRKIHAESYRQVSTIKTRGRTVRMFLRRVGVQTRERSDLFKYWETAPSRKAVYYFGSYIS